MTLPRPPDAEAARLAALQRYEILDTPAEAEFDDFARLAAQVCGAPAALMSLIDGDRVWFKSKVGLDLEEIPTHSSICGRAVDEKGVLVVPDATLDERFKNSPLVTGAPGLRFYAGAPLAAGGHPPIGVLCVIDFQPRLISKAQEESLTMLARQLMMRLEMKASSREHEKQHAALVSLTRGALQPASDEVAVLREITGTVAQALDVERVSLWRFNAGRTAIVCRHLFEAHDDSHSAGMELSAESFPAYFRALEESEVIAAHNAREDPRTREFRTAYLEPLGISSMLDAPVFVGGQPGGVLCIEHIGPPRRWTHSEQSFAVSVTNLVSLMLSHQAQEQSERRFRAIIDSEPECVKIVSVDGQLLDINPAGLCMVEAASFEEFRGVQVEDLVNPAERQAFLDLQDRVRKGATGQLEFRLTGLRGTERWLETHATPMRDADGTISSVLSVTHDVTDRKQAELRLARISRLYQMLSLVNEAIVRVASREKLVERVCQIAVDPGQFLMAAIVAMDATGDRMRPLAHAGAERGYFAEVSVILSDPELNRGPVGTCFRTGRHDICNDFLNDARMSAWREPATRRGYRSNAAFPITRDRQVAAALVLFSGEAGYFEEDEVKLLTAVADNVSFAMESFHNEEQRLRAEAALRASEKSMAAAQNIAHFGSWEMDLSQPGGIRSGALVWSDEMYRIAGHQPGSVKVTNELFYQMAHPDDREAIRQAVDEALRDRQQYSISHRLIRPDGEVRVVHETAQIFFDEASGRPLKMVGTAHDITEERRTEETLLEQATLLDSAQDAILVRDLEDRVQFWNKGAERLYGWTAEEARGRQAAALLYRDPSELAAATRTTLAKGEWVGELHQMNRDGVQLIVESRWTLLRDAGGSPKSIMAINTDITRRKQLEQQFLRAQRMESIGTLAGGIAHDLNNVLSPILMSIELLRLEVRDERNLGILSTVEGAAKRGAALVKQVLSFAQGVSGQKVEVRMGVLVHEIEKIVNDTFLKHIEVKAEVVTGLWTVTGDPTQLHQVLLNLCVNARDAMPNGGRLTLSAANQMLDEPYAAMNIDARPGPHVVLTVEDSGVGMPADVMDRIFEPFFTTKELGKGTGLGLSTTMAIVKSHGGFVRVYSEPGMGTTFRVYLPAQCGTGAETAAETEPELPRGKGELVLLVDDESAVRDITKQTLEAFGYRVLLASDGTEATAIYAERQADIALVLTDMMMPMMDGPTTIQVLMRMNPAVKVVAASGLKVNAMVARATAAGVRHFLPKPYTAETLLRLIQEVLAEGTEAGAS